MMMKQFLCGLLFCSSIVATTAQVADSVAVSAEPLVFLKHAVGVGASDVVNVGFTYRYYATQKWAVQASYAPEIGVKPQAYQHHNVGLTVLYAFYTGKIMSYYALQNNGFKCIVYKGASDVSTTSGVGLGTEIKIAKRIGLNITADIHREFNRHKTEFGLGSAILYKF